MPRKRTLQSITCARKCQSKNPITGRKGLSRRTIGMQGRCRDEDEERVGKVHYCWLLRYKMNSRV